MVFQGRSRARRWLGNIRFTLGALHQVWQQRRYAARVAVYPADSAPPPDPDAPAAAPDARPYQEQRDDTGGTEPDGALQHDGPYQPPGHMRTRSAEQTALQPSSMQQHREQRQPQNSSSRGCLSALCRPGPPTPILDALGDAADVDLEAIAQQHPVRESFPAPCCLTQAHSLMHREWLAGMHALAHAYRAAIRKQFHPCSCMHIQTTSTTTHTGVMLLSDYNAGLAPGACAGDSLLRSSEPAAAGPHLPHGAARRLRDRHGPHALPAEAHWCSLLPGRASTDLCGPGRTLHSLQATCLLSGRVMSPDTCERRDGIGHPARCAPDAGCLDVMHVPDLASRSEALDFLHYLEVGKHLNLETVRLDKAAALIIEPLSSGG